MSLLKRKFRNVIPVWIILVICVGTAAGAFLWISNTLTDYVTVEGPPIELSGEFQDPAYAGIWSTQTFAYTINNMSECTGYLYIQFWVSGAPPLDGSEISLNVRLNRGNASLMSLIVLSSNVWANSIQFVLCDDSFMAIDFSEYGLYTYGSIEVDIMYNLEWFWTISMSVSSTAS